jgi:hypothetical protein
MTWAVAIPAALAAVSGGFQAYSQYQAGQSAKDAANYNANALKRQSFAAQQQGLAEMELRRRQGERIIGQQEAAFAKSGVTASGSPLDVIGDTAANIELDSLNAAYEGYLNARGLRQRSKMAQYEGRLAAYQGKMEAVGTLLTTAATVAGMSAGPGAAPGAPAGGSTYGRGLREASSGRVVGGI